MDLQKFLNAALRPREASIEVPELAEWFGEGEPVAWVVRGLTAAELGRANQAAERGLENVRALVAAMAGEGDKASAIRSAMGLSDEDVPADVSRRIEMLTAGSVSPELGSMNRDVAVRLAEAFPTVFYNLTNNILTLTGQGAELGKPKRSTPTPE